MRKTFLCIKKDFIMPGKITRQIAMLVPCMFCKKETQSDPFSNFLLGPCCKCCESEINNKLEEIVNKYNCKNAEILKEIYMKCLKKSLTHTYGTITANQ